MPLYWIVDGDERLVEVRTPSDSFPRSNGSGSCGTRARVTLVGAA